MRDLFLVLLFPVFLYFGFRSPYISLYLWLWTSMFPLQNWVYGMALSLRFNLVFALMTILGYFIKLKDKPEFKNTLLFTLIIVFFIHCSIGVMLHGVDYQWGKLENFLKAIVFFICCVLMLRKKHHFEAVIVFLVLSLGYFAFMEGLKYIATAGAHRIQGMMGPLGDNNKCALGFNMCIPLIIYLITQTKEKLLKYGYVSVLALSIVGVFATNSRGGLLALLFILSYYWWIGGRKLYIPVLLIGAGFLLINVMPESWMDRMASIENAGEDSSFLGRVLFWKINFLAALDYPLFGLNFDATSSILVWQNYMDEAVRLNWFVDTPPKTRGFVAHSIYFQVLGNQGFLGLGIFLLIAFTIFRTLSKITKYYEKTSWQNSLAKAIRVSFMAFYVGGAALNAAYFELFYLLISIAICLNLVLIFDLKKINTK